MKSLIVLASATGGVSVAAVSDTATVEVVSCFRNREGGVDDDTEAVAKSAIVLYANFIHLVFNELISV